MGNCVNKKQHKTIKLKSKLTASKQELTKTYILDNNVIGAGSFGFVHIGYLRVNPDKKVAIKTIPKTKLRQDQLLLRQEISHLDHPQIVQFYNLFEDDQYFHVVTEYLGGGELAKRIQSCNLHEQDICQIFKQILMGINFLHQQDIIHRDLKPENIMFQNQENNDVKIIDLGFAFQQDEKSSNEKLGTPSYIAPELLDGNYDQKCDMWSLGVILYECITCQKVFIMNSRSKGNIREKEVNFLNDNFDDFDPAVKDLIKGLLEKDPSKRLSALDALSHPWFQVQQHSKIKERKISDIQFNEGLTDHLQKNVIQLITTFMSEKEIHEIKEKFFQIDSNKSGTITYEDLKIVMKQQNIKNYEEKLDNIFENYHRQPDQSLNYHEFIELILNHKEYFTELNLQSAFKTYDKDEDGFISIQDLKDTMQEQSKEKTEQELHQWIQEFDLNQDKLISYEEFKQKMK